MTERPGCDLCHRPLPISDTAYVCTRCATMLGRDLDAAARVAGEAAVTIARLGRGEPGNGRATSVPLPYDRDASDAQWAVHNVFTTWARHICGESGRPAPTVAAEEHPLAVLVQWLAGQLDWLRYRPEAAEAFDELGDAARLAVRVVDRRAERSIIGVCSCGDALYAFGSKAVMTCRGCGSDYDVDSTRSALRRHVEAMLFTAAELATLAVYMGIRGSRERTRKLINVWSSRGVIEARGDYGGAPTYRAGDVLERIAAAQDRAHDVDWGPQGATVTAV